MSKSSLVFLFSIFFLIGCKSEKLPIIKNIHTNWLFKSQNDSIWHSATVPGNVHSDLLDNQLIENPFVLNNEEKVQWVSDSAWVYKTSFKLSDKMLKKNHIDLIFEGIDTRAKIYINGNYQLDTDNAFRNYSIALKDIPLKEINELKLVFDKANFIKHGKTPFENRVYTREAQFQDGWDWGPKLNTVGIWKDVYLKAWDHVLVKDIYIQQDSIVNNKAFLSAKIKIQNPDKKEVFGKITVNNTAYKSVTNTSSLIKIPIIIENPELWWTHNLGKPYLYNFKIEIESERTIIEKKTLKKGIRTIELITKKDSVGQSFYFELNGKPIYAKGANYIPQNSLQNKVTPQKYKKLLSDVVAANMNMLRVWGGGIYENDIFYDLCDEKGILVWQDFMFACAMYPGDVEFLANVEQEAEYQVKRLRNHSSIALWCGNNENSEGWKRWGWQQGKTQIEKNKIWKDYLKVFDQLLPNIVAKNSSTSYWESSPKYGRGNPKHKTEGDAHDWGVWHDAFPFEHFENNVPRFMSEFGFQSFPSFEVIKYINQKDSIDLSTDAIRSHQKHSRGFDLINQYMNRDYFIPESSEDYVYVSQLLQAKGVVMAIEAHRRAKPYNMGSLYWQLNDCWPAISWSGIDYFGNWKALHYKAKKAFENVLISTIKTKYDYETYIVNDSLQDISGTLKLKIIDFYGQEIWSNTKEVFVKANSSQKVYHIPQVDIYRAGYLYIIEFNSSKSLYYFAKPKDLDLPKGIISREIIKTKHGFLITLKSTVLQKDIFLYTKVKGHFSNNFFDLLPNQEMIIEFKTDEKTMDDLQFKTLNQINLLN